MPSSAPPVFAGKTSLVALDAVRGLAALYVMLGHARWLLWSGYSDFAASNSHGLGLATAVLASSLRYGHQAVLLFFLVSGFVIHYRQASHMVQGKGGHLDLTGFAWRRLRRLSPPLLLALVLTMIFDSVGTSLNPDYYSGHSPYQLINDNIGGSSHTFTSFIGNALFQTDFIVQRYGTNSPLWSIAYEFWFYTLYPLALFISRRLGAWTMLGSAAAISALGFLLPSSLLIPSWIASVFTYWVSWVAGAFIAEAYVKRVRCTPSSWFVAPALALLTLLAIRYPIGLSDAVQDLLWTMPLGLLLLILLTRSSPSAHAHVERVGRLVAPLGTISYSLYVVHFPFLVMVSAWWLAGHERLPLGAELIVPGVLAVLALSVACWYIVERHCVSTRSRFDYRPQIASHTPVEVARINISV